MTWDGGGNLQPMLGLGRMLAERGHRVHVLGWNTSPERVGAAGCSYAPFLASIPFDLSLGRTWEEQSDEMFEQLTCGVDGADEVRGWIDRDQPDAVVVDFFLTSAVVGRRSDRPPEGRARPCAEELL